MDDEANRTLEVLDIGAPVIHMQQVRGMKDAYTV
jgi:hypothetical protein